MKKKGDESPIWEQLEGEPNKDFVKFAIYRDLGVHRTLLAAYMVYRQQRGNVGLKPNFPGRSRPFKCAPKDWTAAVKEWDWDARVAAFDKFQRQEEVSVQRRLREQEEKIRLDRVKKQINDEWELRGEILEKVREMLRHPLYTKTFSDDGKTVIIAPSKWTMQHIAMLGRLAMDLGRSSTGMDVKPASELENIYGLIRSGWLSKDQIIPITEKIGELEEFAQKVLGGAIEVEPEEE